MVTKYGSVKRFGPRYGRKLKYKLGRIEFEKLKSKKCPYCSKEKAKRIAAGIWYCKKCNFKFTGGAYTIKKAVSEEKSF